MKTYRTQEFADAIGVHVSTVKRWDYAGKLPPDLHTPNGQRVYTQTQVDKYLGIEPVEGTKGIYLYARVSSTGQKEDLTRQVDFLREFANARGYLVADTLTDVGSGMNYKRKNWNKLIRLILAKKVSKVVVAYPDRFVRFGFDWFKELAKEYDCDIEVINNPDLSPHEELTADLISIIQVFSSRLYGLRKYKKKVETDKELK